MIRAAAAFGLFAALGNCCCANGAGQKSSQTRPAKKEQNVMRTSQQAFEAACQSVKAHRAGDIHLVKVDGQYQVAFDFVIEASRRRDYVIHVVVDAVRGVVLNGVDKGQLPATHGRSAGDGWESFISARKAYDIAFGALAGFSEYDPYGPLSVELWDDVYRVTFPAHAQEGARGPDYAMQIHVSARTGKVVKVLVAG